MKRNPCYYAIAYMRPEGHYTVKLLPNWKLTNKKVSLAFVRVNRKNQAWARCLGRVEKN